MNVDRFIRERQGTWTELQALVADAGRHPERLGPARVRRLGTLYRAVAADLAIARRRFATDPVTARLEDLANRSRYLVYDVQPRREGIVAFLTTGYWRRIRERPALVAVAAALLLAPAIVAAAWGLAEPAEAGRAVPAEFRGVTEPRAAGEDLGIGVDEQAALASMIFTNNIQVSFLAFAGGITAGIGTALVVVFNGFLLGVISGLAFGAGNGRPFVELVVAHGILELSCIVVAAAAGLRLGWALVDPGRRTRPEALVAEGRPAVELALGTVPWLVVAGFVEGFLTPAGLGLGPAVSVGVVFGGVYWALVWWRGAGEPATDELAPSPAGTP